MTAIPQHVLDAIPTARSRKALVAMSGGVDSSVAAAAMVRAGWDVVGCFMRLGTPGESLEEAETRIHHRGCCSIGDAADARLVAAELGIPLYVCNFREDFGRIIDYFVDEYARGRTPNPCVRCNDWLKFGKLHAYARTIGASVVVSGHYARTQHRDGRSRLLRGRDRAKDQSYVLFGADPARLGEMVLPVGEFESKAAVRDAAAALGLPVASKPDSQEICFVPDDDYAGLVERRRPGLAVEGQLLTVEGRHVGTHAGQHRFTIGQRRGLGVAIGEPAYVIDRDARTNTVTIGPRERLRAASATVGEANWLGGLPPEGPVVVRYRAHGRDVRAQLRHLADAAEPGPSGRVGRFELTFDEPQLAIAPGQAAVLYDADDPDLVLGGGWIQADRRHDYRA
ncbi:MAG: tRNA 2-thiouridine(34) synthase MnmA [Planctomycetota bacterium]